MQSLDLNIEDRIGIDFHTADLADMFRKSQFVFAFDLGNCFLNGFVIRKLVEFLQLFEIAAPGGTDLFRNELGESGIGFSQPAARRDTVRDIDEFAGIELAEIAEKTVLQQFRMKRGNAVHSAAGNNAHIRHSCHLHRRFFDQGHAGKPVSIPDILGRNFPEETEIDLVNDFQMTRKKFFQNIHGPFLKRFAHERMIRVVEGLRADIPRFIPEEVLLIDQETHQFGNRESRMGIVQLDHIVFREIFQGCTGKFDSGDDILKGRAHKEILLFQTQFLAFIVVVVRIEDPGDVSGKRSFQIRIHIITLIEFGKIEFADRFRRPQTQRVDRVVAVSRDRGVVRHCEDILR